MTINAILQKIAALANKIRGLEAGALPAAGADGNVLTSDGTNWASEAPSAGGGSGVSLLGTTDAVNLNTATATTLYTVPADKVAYITNVVPRDPSVSLTTVAFSIGWNSADFNNVIANATHTELDGATKYTQLHADAGAVEGAAAGVLKLKCNTLQGEAATCSVDVFGYLIDA